MKLARYILEHNMTQEELAKKLGFCQSYVSQILRGEKPASRNFIARACKLSGGFLEPNDFFTPVETANVN